jgi:exopolysaccharide production protein ExoY
MGGRPFLQHVYTLRNTRRAGARKIDPGVALGSIPIFRRVVFERSSGWQIVCLCERAAALLLLILSLPVTLTAALLIWIRSGRTPLIAHRRIGREGATLWMLKLRTMWGQGVRRTGGGGGNRWVEHIADDIGPERKLASDPRVAGSFPQFLRRHSIDELPQLWHVISGEMSLVGPRPMTERELRKYYGIHADEILRLRPGLAGLWQTSGRNHLTYDDRRRLDLEFVRNRSLGMYVGILLRTVPEVLRGQNSW